jgi:hypothetical protein
VKNAEPTIVYNFDEKNTIKKFGVRTKQGQRNDLKKDNKNDVKKEIIKQPITGSRGETACDVKYALELLLLAEGFKNIVWIHNCVLGIDMNALHYALFYFKNYNQQVLQLCIVKSIIKAIERASNILENANYDTLKFVANQLRNKPQLFYKPPNNKFYDVISKFDNKQLKELCVAFHDNDVSDFNDDDEIINEYDSDFNSWIIKKNKEDDEPIEKRLIETNSHNLNRKRQLFQIVSFLLEHEIKYDGELDFENIHNAIKNYNPPTERTFGEITIYNIIHGIHPENDAQQSIGFLFFCDYYNFSTRNTLFAINAGYEVKDYFVIPENLCYFECISIAIIRSIAGYDNNDNFTPNDCRYEKILDLFSSYNFNQNTMILWKLLTGLDTAGFHQKIEE